MCVIGAIAASGVVYVARFTVALGRSGVFLLLLPRPPRPTLFPYTTLFRSVPHQPRHQNVPGTMSATKLSERPLERADRKSTRLNSSHGYISYAVFCLKKKTIARDWLSTWRSRRWQAPAPWRRRPVLPCRSS